MEGDMLLIGIGCNVLSAPTVNTAANSAAASPLIRPATCLAEHNAHYAQTAATLRQELEQQHPVEQNCDGTASVTDNNVEGVPYGETGTTGEGVSIHSTLREGDFHKELGIEICENLYDWLTAGSDTAATVVRDFERNMDFSPQRLRDVADAEKATVVPVGLNSDGTLKVGPCLTFADKKAYGWLFSVLFRLDTSTTARRGY
jgi:hypothetical protein